MAAGADSINDLDVIRSGGMKQVFGGLYASATLGILLREFTHGHTRQLSAVLRRHLITLAGRTPVLHGIDEQAFIDIDSLLRPVYGHAKQGTSFGHTKIAGKTILRRGLSPLAVTISTETAAPVVAAVRLRAGRAGSSRGAASMITEAINTATAAGAHTDTILVRGDSAYGNGKVITAAIRAPRGRHGEQRGPAHRPADKRMSDLVEGCAVLHRADMVILGRVADRRPRRSRDVRAGGRHRTRTPARYTALTAVSVVRSVSGSPATASRSASNPGAMRPLWSPSRHACAATEVIALSASTGGAPSRFAIITGPYGRASSSFSGPMPASLLHTNGMPAVRRSRKTAMSSGSSWTTRAGGVAPGERPTEDRR
jgi:hypothetical protein